LQQPPPQQQLSGVQLVGQHEQTQQSLLALAECEGTLPLTAEMAKVSAIAVMIFLNIDFSYLQKCANDKSVRRGKQEGHVNGAVIIPDRVALEPRKGPVGRPRPMVQMPAAELLLAEESADPAAAERQS
jgi:hypothetical protein